MNNKVCGFFASNFHLLTTMLPYIDKKIAEGKKVELIFEKDMKNDLNKFLNNVRKIDINKKEIEKLNWKKTKVTEIRDTNEAIIVGSMNFINKMNENISGECEEIVNFFDINQVENINEVLEKHNAVLKTIGKEEIIKNSQNAQKRKTIHTQI